MQAAIAGCAPLTHGGRVHEVLGDDGEALDLVEIHLGQREAPAHLLAVLGHKQMLRRLQRLRDEGQVLGEGLDALERGNCLDGDCGSTGADQEGQRAGRQGRKRGMGATAP